jgi:hypothetical protein
MNWKLNSNLTAMSIVAACLVLAGGTVVGAYHSFKHLGWIAVFPVAGFLFADYMGAHLIFFSHKEKGVLGWSAMTCKFLVFGTLLLNGASLVYLLITESKDRVATANKLEEAKARTEIETTAKVKLIEAESAARRAEDKQRAENAAKLAAATGNARLARAAMTTRPARNALNVAPSLSPTPAPESGAAVEEKAKDEPTTFERFVRWYTRAPLYFSGGLVGLLCFVLMQVFGKIAADRKAHADESPDEIDIVEHHAPARFGNLVNAPEFLKAPERALIPASLTNDGPGAVKETTRNGADEGLRRLRVCLKLIEFHHSPMRFKADLKDDHIWIRAMESSNGQQHTTHSAKAALSILDDALTMEPGAFRERLETFLKKRGFEL